VNFAAPADQLRRQEIARLTDAVVPTLEILRGMTVPAFRAVVAVMWERFGHHIVTDPAAADLVTTKNGRKFITECARPADLAPTGTRDLARLDAVVIAANAVRGVFITARSFTAEAEQYAARAPLDLIDGARLIRGLNQNRKHVLLPQTYKAMCAQCGEIVQDRLGDDEARPSGNGHPVAPTIARAMIVPPRISAHAQYRRASDARIAPDEPAPNLRAQSPVQGTDDEKAARSLNHIRSTNI